MKGRIMTYSIVARDPDTGQMGVAVQSHYFSVGPVVPWGEAGIGVVATQAFAEPSYGPLGLDLMRGGKSAGDALRSLIEVDALADRRQVAMIDNAGEVAAHTGGRTIQGAGHITGENYSVQANMMLTDTVPEAMSKVFEAAGGELVERMLTALDAAEAEGGDIRGKQSAAILVVKGERAANPYVGRVLELRVEDHPDPLAELRRLLGVKRAYELNNAGAVHLGQGNESEAMAAFDRAQRSVPENAEFSFWACITLASTGRFDQARRFLDHAKDADGEWIELLRRLPACEMLSQEAVDELLSELEEKN